MIIDADNVSEPAALSADVCIVGAGAAGISLALQFIGTNVEVLLLESGGLGPEVATQALYEGQVVDERLHSPPDRYRQRRFGGTTTIWGGRCMPFDPIDFEPRDYVAAQRLAYQLCGPAAVLPAKPTGCARPAISATRPGIVWESARSR